MVDAHVTSPPVAGFASSAANSMRTVTLPGRKRFLRDLHVA
jgi:hypothetical protein